MDNSVEELERVAQLFEHIDAHLQDHDLVAGLLEPLAGFLKADMGSIRSFVNARGRPRLGSLVTLAIPSFVDDAYRSRYFQLDPTRRRVLRIAPDHGCEQAGEHYEWCDDTAPTFAPDSRDEFAIYRREFLIPSHFIHYVGFCCPLRNGQLVAFDFQRSGRSPGFSSLERARARIIAQYFRLQRAGYEALPGLAPRERCEGALTAREYQVAQAVALGQSNKEVAASLSISVRTVENHMRSIFAKLGVRRRTHLAAKLHDWHG